MIKQEQTTKIKLKKCKACGNKFAPFNSLAQVCSIDCAIKYSKDNAVQERVNRKINKIRRDKLKTLTQRLNEAQTVFNAYIRERDKNEPCISCGTCKPNIQYHAGHYRSVGACRRLRFNELNVHKQCSTCNNHKSGNAIEYRIGLIKKIGLEKVEWLESQNAPYKYTDEEAEKIKATYKLKLKQLKKGA